MLFQQISPIQLSKYVIDYVSKTSADVSHLKLQKLLYYIEAWHLVYFEQPLFKQEFQAWVHGPVIRDVWDHYREKSILNGLLPAEPLDYQINDSLSVEQIELINDVLDEYGIHTAYHLECLTHDEIPWKEARRGYGASDRCEKEISKITMRKFYRDMAYDE